MRTPSLALFLVVLFATSTLPVVDASNPEPTILEGRIFVVALDQNTSYETTVDLDENSFIQLTLICRACTASLTGDNMNASGTERIELFSVNTTSIALNIVTTETETVQFTLHHDVMDSFPHVRPGPPDASPHHPIGVCTDAVACMDTLRGTLAAVVDDSTDLDVLQSGVVNSTADEYMTIDVSNGDTLEWQWLDTTEETTVTVYFQNMTGEIMFESTLSSTSGHTELNGLPLPVEWWTAPDYGRFIVRISSPVFPAIWTAHAMIHTNTPTTPLIGQDLIYGAELLGHGSTISAFDWNETQALELHSRLGQMTLRVDQLLNGAWVTGQTDTLEKGDSRTIYPYPGNVGGRIVINDVSVFSLELQTNEYSDNNAGLDAPSYLPASLDLDNTSWPAIELTEASSGELTLAVHDTVDTYRFVVDGWEDSVHFIQFTITGNVSEIEAQLWDVDQMTSEVLDTVPSVVSGDSLRISMQVGRGTHYLQIRAINSSNVTQHAWGSEVPSIDYTLSPSYSLIDEGEEPWFPPSEDAVFWGGVARWVLGTAFLIPVVYLLAHLQRSRNYGREIFSKKERLEWYRTRLDSGEANVTASQKDLVRSLHAVAQLEWNDGLNTWGKPSLHHRTEGLDLAVWRIDRRMAKTPGTWPLVLGVHVLEGEWDLAAIRFDAPGGAAYTIRNVEPRFLFQGEEVFLDTLKQGHRMFLMVELEGDAPAVDIELNGRMNTIPFASRIPTTFTRDEEE